MSADSLVSGCPSLRRWLEEHPHLAPELRSVLRAGEVLRAARELALVGDSFPQPERDERFHACRLELDQALGVLEAAATLGDEREASEAVSRWLAAIFELRAADHAFAPTRETSSPAARADLFVAIEAFREAFKTLKQAADDSHVARIPWRVAFSSHVAPNEPMGSLELTGYDLPSVPVSSLSWGEHCLLTGRCFHTDSNRRPQVRYRSLDSCNFVLDPAAYEILERSRRALSSLVSVCHEKLQEVVAAVPQLFEHFVAEDCSAAFAKLGLSDFPSLAVTLNNALVRFADRPLFGAHGIDGGFANLGGRDPTAAVLREKERHHGFRWLSYGEVRQRALELAFSLEDLGLEAGVRIGVFSDRNTPECHLVDFACVFSNLVSVGLHDGFTDDALSEILRAAAPAAVFCSSEGARRLARCGLGKEVLLVLTNGTMRAVSGALPSHRGIRSADLESTGRKMPNTWASRSGIGPATRLIHDDGPGWQSARRHRVRPDTDDDRYTVIFTSGSTGSPKGYPVTRRRWREGMEYGANIWPYVVVSYQPFALAADRKAVWQIVLNGGRVGFARPGSLLFDDIREVRPTYFEGPPAIWGVVTGEYSKEMSRAGTDPRARAQAILRLQELLGGRLAAMAVGGAPSDEGMRNALEGLFGLPMGEGYGTTETGTIAASGKLLAHLDYRVLDVPELGLTSGERPYPRGELAVRPSTGLGEYLTDGGSTADRFTQDGYFRTGDLVEVRPDGSYRMLGRRIEALKLGGGEFVPPTRLEELLRLSPLIRQVFVTTKGSGGSLVAVVVPSHAAVTRQEVLSEIRRIAPRVGLRPFEIPAAVVLDPPPKDGGLPWRPDNGLLTKSWKLDRFALATRFSEEITNASAETEARRESFSDARLSPSFSSTREWPQEVATQAAEVLGLATDEIDLERTFADHGGGSLASIELLLRLESLSGFPLSAGHIGVEELALRDVAERIRRLSQTQNEPVESVHDSGARSTETAACRRSESEARQIAEDIVGGSFPQAPADWGRGLDTLVTGGTGFLGTHLVAELARSLPDEARVFTLVRARNHQAARDRLTAALGGIGEDGLSVRPIDKTGAQRVVAVAGSLDEPQLGLATGVWRSLAAELGQVIHAGAEVRHDATYRRLRETNVEGTRRVLELALTGRMKGFHLVSSLDVAHLVSRQSHRPPSETAPLPKNLSDEIVATSTGYALSKWVAEILVERALRQSGGGFSASISRPALISWSSRNGVANESDWLTRFLLSCLELGCAPCEDEAGVPGWAPLTPTSARGLDLVPVEFVARSIAHLTMLTTSKSLPETHALERVPTFHISNPNPGQSGLVTWPHLLHALAAAHYRATDRGQPLRQMPIRRWRLLVAASAAPFSPLLGTFEPLPAFPRTEARDFHAIVSGREGPRSLECPPFSVDLVERFVTRFVGERVPQTDRQAP